MEKNQNKNNSKFYVDAMLGNIARKLRLMGYDTAYSSDIDDIDLIKKAKKENRIIISKDIQLISLAKKQSTDSIKINHDIPFRK